MDVVAVNAAPATPEAEAFDEGAFVREALRTFENWVQADQHNRDEMLDDLNVQALIQWDELEKQRRTAMGRPTFTVDMCGSFVRTVSGELNENPPSAAVHPGEDGDFEVAEVMGGLWRSIEGQSHADVVYALAGGQAAACGRGSFRLSHEFEGDDTFLTCLRLRSIPNTHAVVWDPAARLPDKQDARGCFVYEDMARDVYEARWPNAAKAEWPGMDASWGNRTGWFSRDTIRVAEYWQVEHVPARMVQLSDGTVLRDPTPGELMQVLDSAMRRGVRLTLAGTRNVMRRKVVMRLLNGVEILPKADGTKAPYEWLGSRIPIFSVEGEEIHRDGRVDRRGLIRGIKHEQRIRNWAVTAEVETVALGTTAKWLATHKMVKGREHLWRNANASSAATLIYEHDPDVPGGPRRIDPPDENRAAGALADRAVDNAKTTTGIFNAGLGEQGNETSGKAIKARQAQSNRGSNIFIKNLTVQIQAAAEAGVELIPKVYDTTRQVRWLGEDMTPKVARVNDGKLDLNRGRYDIIIRTGPTYINQRQERGEALVEMARMVGPQAAPVVIAEWARTQDYPGAREFAAKLEAAMGVSGQPQPAGAMRGQGGGAMPAQNAPNAPAMRLAGPAPAQIPGQGPDARGGPPIAPAEMYDMATMGAPPGVTVN